MALVTGDADIIVSTYATLAAVTRCHSITLGGRLGHHGLFYWLSHYATSSLSLAASQWRFGIVYASTVWLREKAETRIEYDTRLHGMLMATLLVNTARIGYQFMSQALGTTRLR